MKNRFCLLLVTHVAATTYLVEMFPVFLLCCCGESFFLNAQNLIESHMFFQYRIVSCEALLSTNHISFECYIPPAVIICLELLCNGLL